MPRGLASLMASLCSRGPTWTRLSGALHATTELHPVNDLGRVPGE